MAGEPIFGSMGANWLIPAAIVLATVIAMEGAAAAVHRFVMHGPGWRLHRSHHEERTGPFELNDLYALLFSGLSILLFTAGATHPTLWWVALGTVGYGILYAMLHDALVHRRIPFPKPPRSGYLKRLVQAHRLHHAVQEREGAVSFGFLYARPISGLLKQLRANRARG